ncbi:hypothetical protein RHGRI_009002 [Rhododendron griersonianum]|uniref:Uncharacterized protein n=1 Tax=Rhododendron griersonianum TaxID=479676 RepID=A0AAV6L2N0_9ERIC|nr:hypothetical protein RHGRI_009002 [Rhododendron griersonianum]KAG5559314.1 hypothetical protein RHGRI_009002 [Rhododendron griersonianum]
MDLWRTKKLTAFLRGYQATGSSCNPSQGSLLWWKSWCIHLVTLPTWRRLNREQVKLKYFVRVLVEQLVFT